VGRILFLLSVVDAFLRASLDTPGPRSLVMTLGLIWVRGSEVRTCSAGRHARMLSAQDRFGDPRGRTVPTPASIQSTSRLTRFPSSTGPGSITLTGKVTLVVEL